MTPLFGKYRGKVEENVDPMLSGRLQVSSYILGQVKVWALPCVPYAGSGVGFHAMPPKGANVWIEFEGGNRHSPIWAGCFWAVGELPPALALAEIKVFKTDTATLTLSDLPGIGGVTIETSDGKKITMNALKIEITDGMWKVALTPVGVSINDGALEVT